MNTEKQSTTIATQTPAAPATTTPKRTVKELLGSDVFRAQLQAALPKHLTPDRMVRVVLTAGMKNPKLFQCTQESLFLCVLNCAAVGLEPDGRRAHLIPFANKSKGTMECTLIYGYQGLCELVMRSGLVSNIHADTVCDMDIFKANAGQLEAHEINYKAPRGKAYAAYCIVRFKDGSHIVEIMARDEIEEIRDNSQGYRAWKAGIVKSSPWADTPGEMWKKTACRRVVKWCPQSPELTRALDDDNSEAIDIEAAAKAPAADSLNDILNASAVEPEQITGEAKTDPPPAPEPTPEEKAKADAARAKLRKKIVDEIEALILDGKTTEAALIGRAKTEKLAPWDKEPGYVAAGIGELPTETLAKLTA